MQRWICLFSLVLVLLSPLGALSKTGILLDINGPIGPATQDYVQRGIKQGIQEQASLIILEINTPGGLETSMRGINEAIISSSIPVITYVAPSGARAASAGTFIVYASHIAYMAPGTNIGAASPVDLSALSNEAGQKMSTEEKKATNDAAAYIRSLAQLRGRNIEWGEKAVREAASLSAQEAKELNVIDDVIQDYPHLLKNLDGRLVKLDDKSITLETKDLVLKKIPHDLRYKFLSFLTNPNIAYILMLVAAYGIFFELSSPGLILPGVVGVISLVLVLYAFQLMQINYVGLTLILIGLSFMILELFVSSFGILGIGGLISFIIGSVMLFDVQGLDYSLTLPVIISISIITAVFFFIILRLAIKSHKKPVISGAEGLIGQEGVVLSVIGDEVTVRVLGEIWKAKSSSTVSLKQTVKVTSVKGLLLNVEPMAENKKLTL